MLHNSQIWILIDHHGRNSFDLRLFLIFPTKSFSLRCFSFLGKSKISKNGPNVWRTYTAAFLVLLQKSWQKSSEGKFKKNISLQVLSLNQTYVPQRPSSFHMSNKIGKFLPRKRARPQIEAAQIAQKTSVTALEAGSTAVHKTFQIGFPTFNSNYLPLQLICIW